MKFRLLVVHTILFLVSVTSVFSQEGIPCDSLKASVSCETAPIICDLNCLDGFNARMPDTLYTADSLRNILCPSFGGQASNMSWFAFVAGSTTIELRVLLDNCVKGVQNELGVQSAIYATCDLPPNGNISVNDVLDCYAPTTPSISDFTLFSDQFIVGQVYYFFIDGFAATVCDYEIEVVQGAQPFPLDELGVLVSKDSIPADTVCLGHKNYLLRPSIGELDIDYFWKITPSTPDYPDTFRLLGYNTFWKFNSPGDYEVSVYATNGCDVTDTISQNITVMPLGTEIFDTVAVCFNDFPYAGPLSQDPNGDGVVGWLGPNIQYPGDRLVTHEVTISTSGCKYTQEVFVDEISPKPRENVLVYSCQPFDYNGTMITQSVQNMNFTLPGMTALGCDSMVSLTAVIIDLQGNISVIDCDNGGLKIGFNNTNISAPPGYTLTYKWFDSAQELVDNDAVEGDIIITKRDFYRVEVTMHFGQDSCIFDIPAELIDPDDNRPQITAEDWTLNICDDDNIGTYKIASDQPIKEINWSIPIGATYALGNANSSEIMVDFTNSGSGTIAVSVENFCSGVSTIDFPIEIVQTPVASYILPTEICRETEITLLALGSSNPDFQYIWKIPSQAIVTSGSLNSRGPINIEFNGNSGNYPVELIISNGNCRDSLIRNITVLPDIPMLIVQCSQQANSVTFTWDNEGCAESYSIIQNGNVIATVSETTYTFDNLAINTTIDIEILINSTCMCKGSTTPASCTSLDCNDVIVDLTAPSDLLCEDAWTSDLQFTLNIMGGSSAGMVSWNGNFIDDNGLFDAITAGKGTHSVEATYSENGCIYTATSDITLMDNPSVDLQVYDPQCIDELFGSLQILAQGGDGNYTYLLDNTNVNKDVDDVEIGDHTIQIVDGNSCQVIKTFTIDPTPIITYDIEGLTEIYESDIMNVALNYTMSELSLIDSISWYINGILHCNSLDCAEVTLGNLEPGEYEHNIFIYYNDCVIEESYFVLVKETSKVFIPQIFSPNNDGNNDYWFIASNDPTLLFKNVSILNRWGNKVFSKQNFIPASEPELWDGTFNGDKVQPGVYILLIDYIDEFGVNQIIKKDITVIY